MAQDPFAQYLDEPMEDDPFAQYLDPVEEPPKPTSTFADDMKRAAATRAAAPPERLNPLTEIYNDISKPLWEAPARWGGQFGEWMAKPEADDSVLTAQAKGAFGGAVEGIGNTISGLTSPLDILTGVATGGAGLAAKAGLKTGMQALKGVAKGLNLATAAHGAEAALNPFNENTLAQRATGLMELAGGGAGYKGLDAMMPAAPKPVPSPIVPPAAPKVMQGLDYSVSATERANKILREQGLGEQALGLTNKQIVEAAEALRPGHQAPTTGKPKVKVTLNPQTNTLEPDLNDPFTRSVVEAAKKGEPVKNRVDPNEKIETPTPKDIYGERVGPDGKDLPYTLDEIVGVPRAINSAYDISFPMRQGRGLIHTKGWWSSWDDMVKSMTSQKAYDGLMESIYQRPNFKSRGQGPRGGRQTSFAEEAGLDIVDGITKREEAIGSRLAEQIPGIKASNRAYNAFANKLRADTFDNLISQAEAQGLSPRTNLPLARQIADYVNIASGRGKLSGKVLGKEFNFESSAKLLNEALFSPRLMASRIQSFSKIFDPSLPWFVRKQYLKSMASTAVSWATINGGLAKLGGAEVSTDPDSADFLKPKIGNTRFDPGAGFQQYLVLMHRLASGERTSSTTGKTTTLGSKYGVDTMQDIVYDFLANKYAPVPRAIHEALGATPNKPVGLGDTTAKLFTPIIVQGFMEVMRENPELLPFSVPADMIGIGTQTYGGADEQDYTFISPENDLMMKSPSPGQWDMFR